VIAASGGGARHRVDRAGAVLAQGTVVRFHQEAVSIGNHSAVVLEDSSVVGIPASPVATAGDGVPAPLSSEYYGSRVERAVEAALRRDPGWD
jgi:hypothetical protein